VIGSPWKRSKRDRDIIGIAGSHPCAAVPEAGVPELPRVPTLKPADFIGNKESE
jgi:hypothetical protein